MSVVCVRRVCVCANVYKCTCAMYVQLRVRGFVCSCVHASVDDVLTVWHDSETPHAKRVGLGLAGSPRSGRTAIVFTKIH